MSGGRMRAMLRLVAVQGSWNYERMTGVGMGYAAQPLLEELEASDPQRYAEASVRSAEFFNSHPYLAGVALGALARAEYDHVPGEQITRLRTALCSPLGALGDQLFWAGLVPAVMGAAIVALTAGLGVWTLLVLVLAYNLARAATGIWSLEAGLAGGMQVAGVIGRSWLPPAANRAGLAAGLLAGMALPLAATWLLEGQYSDAVGLAMVTLGVGLLLGWRGGPRVTAVRFGLVAIGLAAALAWGWG